MVTINYRNYHFITIRHLQGTAQVDIWIFVQINPNNSWGCIWTKIYVMFTISTGESLTRTAFPFESMVEIYASYDKVDEFSLSWNLLRLKFLIYKTIFKQQIISEELLSYKWNGEITQEDKQVNTTPSQSSKSVWELETQFDGSFIHSRCEEV